MSSLSGVMEQFQYGFSFDQPSLEQYKINSVCDEVKIATAKTTPLQGKMSEAQLKQALARLRNSQDLSRKQLKSICYGQLDVFKDTQEDKELFDRFLRQAKRNINGFMMKALLQGYLFSYNPESYITKKLHYLLSKNYSLVNEKDMNRVKKFGFLEDQPAKRLGKLILQDQLTDCSDLFREAKLNRSGEGRGILTELFREICLQLELHNKPERLNWFISYCMAGMDIIFKDQIEDYASALLKPWVDETPSAHQQQLIQDFLLNNFGDPRVRAGRWPRVPEESKGVLYRWLVSHSFELMLEVLSASNDTGHCRERKAFWETFNKAGIIDEAWGVFGSYAYISAKKMERSDRLSKGGYGHITSGSSQRNHSVILLRIGDFIISEWTHDGKVRCFTLSDPKAPKLYRDEYNADKIRNDLGMFAISHYTGWQRRVRSELRKITGHSIF